MIKVRKNNLLILAMIICLISLFAFSYNVSVKTVISGVSEDNVQLLQANNEQIINRLKASVSTEEWADILEQYDKLDIVVEDKNHIVIAENDVDIVYSEGISQRKQFEYKGGSYTLISSVHLLNNFSDYMGSLINFIITELLIGISFLLVTIMVLYLFVLRPYKAFYDSMEEYEKTGKIVKRKFRGYVGKVYNRFFELTENLQQNGKNQKRIIASISHDIKTPLTSIMGYSERLSKDNISEEKQKQYLETIYSKAVEIRTLVDEFDEFLGYTASGELEKERIKLSELFEGIKKEYEDELSAYSVKAEFVYEAGNEEIVADRKRLSRVFGNIIGNSVKHFKTEKDNIIKISVASNKKEAILTIEDNGEGVKKENLEVIFEPFYTSDKGRKVAGLGLSICREIIESHQGQIYAVASDMGGLAVVIKLPVYSLFD